MAIFLINGDMILSRFHTTVGLQRFGLLANPWFDFSLTINVQFLVCSATNKSARTALQRLSNDCLSTVSSLLQLKPAFLCGRLSRAVRPGCIFNRVRCLAPGQTGRETHPHRRCRVLRHCPRRSILVAAQPFCEIYSQPDLVP